MFFWKSRTLKGDLERGEEKNEEEGKEKSKQVSKKEFDNPFLLDYKCFRKQVECWVKKGG